MRRQQAKRLAGGAMDNATKEPQRSDFALDTVGAVGAAPGSVTIDGDMTIAGRGERAGAFQHEQAE
jgi:hypothetical protein